MKISSDQQHHVSLFLYKYKQGGLNLTRCIQLLVQPQAGVGSCHKHLQAGGANCLKHPSWEKRIKMLKLI